MRRRRQAEPDDHQPERRYRPGRLRLEPDERAGDELIRLLRRMATEPPR